ncbi:hypothetical protein [Methanobrevibacter sp.]
MSEYEGVEDTLFIPLTARVNISKMFPDIFMTGKLWIWRIWLKISRLRKNLPNIQ